MFRRIINMKYRSFVNYSNEELGLELDKLFYKKCLRRENRINQIDFNNIPPEDFIKFGYKIKN